MYHQVYCLYRLYISDRSFHFCFAENSILVINKLKNKTVHQMKLSNFVNIYL